MNKCMGACVHMGAHRTFLSILLYVVKSPPFKAYFLLQEQT